jgi:hypothetical protein
MLPKIIIPKIHCVIIICKKNDIYFLCKNGCVYMNKLCNNNIIQCDVDSINLVNNQIIATKTDRIYNLLTHAPIHSQLHMLNLPNEIIEMIQKKLGLRHQINFKRVRKRFSFFQLDFWSRDESTLITDSVLANNNNIVNLDLSFNKHIKILENLPYLEKINITLSSVRSLRNVPRLKTIYTDLVTLSRDIIFPCNIKIHPEVKIIYDNNNMIFMTMPHNVQIIKTNETLVNHSDRNKYNISVPCSYIHMTGMCESLTQIRY